MSEGILDWMERNWFTRNMNKLIGWIEVKIFGLPTWEINNE